MLKRKMIRDIKNHKTQFLSIFLMAFLGVFVFSGLAGESLGLEESANHFYEETNLADGWIYSPYLNDLFLKQVDYLGATEEMERQLVIESQADFKKHPDVTLHFVENNTISKYYPAEGGEVNISDSNGVWLDKSFADANGFKIGDNITFTFEGYEITKQVRGIGYSPEYVYHSSEYSIIPDYEKIGFAYLSHKAFPGDTVPYNVLNVKFSGKASTYDDLLSYRLDGYYITFLERSEHSSVNQFSSQIGLHKMMTDIFPFIFILVSMLILLTTMTRIITHQRTQIGVLKATGFKNRTIILNYLSYGFWLVTIGSILGMILGPLIIPRLIYPVMNYIFVLPLWKSAWSMDFVYVSVAMIVLSLVVSLFSAKVISDEKPSESIKPKSPKLSTTKFIERFGFWQKTSFNVRWNYRDAKRNKFRALMTVIGVMGCTILLICAFGLNDSMNDISDWNFNHINTYDSEFILDQNASQSEIDRIVGEVNGEELMQSVIEMESPHVKKTGLLTVLEGRDLVRITDSERNRLEISDGEISISQKMMDVLDVEPGDTVRWHIMDSDKWIETKISDVHANPNTQGLVMTKNTLEGLNLNYTPTKIVSGEHIDRNYSAVKSYSTQKDRMENWHWITFAAWILIYALIIFASVLAIIVLYNLGLLSFTEIEREIATLKILGFKTKDLRKILLTQNLWFTCIGFVLGLPLGDFILKTMWQSAGDSYYVLPYVSITNFILTAIITFSISIIVNLMFSGKIRKIDMVESLKNCE